MASLTEVSYYARKGINLFIISIVVIIIGRFAFFGIIGLKDRFFPSPPPPANNALGPLPFPTSEGSEATPSGLTYTLETVDGKVITMPKTVKVFALTPDNQVSFGTFDRMKAMAVKLGFTSEPQKSSGSTYQFTDSANSLRSLTIDELSGNFEIKYNYSSDLSVFNAKDFKSQGQVTDTARNFFSGLDLLTPDLATGSAKLSYLKIDGQNLINTTSLANADAVYVSFERGPVDDLPIVYPNAQKGLVGALVTGSSAQDNKKILEARYFHSTVDLNSTGTYDAITGTDAYAKLQKGEAIFSSLPSPLPKSILIRSITLGYLDPNPPQGYLQPVVIFSDDKGFQALVPAVKF